MEEASYIVTPASNEPQLAIGLRWTTLLQDLAAKLELLELQTAIENIERCTLDHYQS